jgi:RecA/RadA recombinase
MSNFFNDLVEQLKDEDTTILADGSASAEYSGCIDTGSYALNALLSGSIYGGVPNNKVTAFAGESATGKTFFVLGVVKRFLDDNPDGGVIYFDTEAAVTKGMMDSRGIDTKRVVVSEPDTIQKFRHTALQIIEKYSTQPEDKRKPMIMVLDSLGQLSSTKEMEDTAEGKETRDMTKSQILKATFRVLNLKLAKIGVPLLVTNHVYDVVGCALAGTTIQTTNGLKNIEDISVGDYVRTMVGNKKVTQTFKYECDHYYEIEMENNRKYYLTEEHKLMIQDGTWKKVKDLTVEDVVINIGTV